MSGAAVVADSAWAGFSRCCGEAHWLLFAPGSGWAAAVPGSLPGPPRPMRGTHQHVSVLTFTDFSCLNLFSLLNKFRMSREGKVSKPNATSTQYTLHLSKTPSWPLSQPCGSFLNLNPFLSPVSLLLVNFFVLSPRSGEGWQEERLHQHCSFRTTPRREETPGARALLWPKASRPLLLSSLQ